VATSGALRTAQPLLDLVEIPKGVPIVSRDDVQHAKPNPDLWLAAAAKLSVPPSPPSPSATVSGISWPR
jgi:beta-phosphoglucomutase-like phosphatase (HAD superfamily)